MAFTSDTLMGNIVSDGNGAGFFVYKTGDTKAEVLASNYFKQPGNQVIASKTLTIRDIVMCQCSDGLIVLIVAGLGASITTAVKWTEA